MSRYIDADKLKYFGNHIGDEYEDRFHDAQWAYRSDIEDAPSIDIVRCGECMHNGSYDTDCPFGWKNGKWNMPKPCDFCSYGERSDK